MGYLNNSTRVLDAILTKKGRELLSSGGNFNVTKFALGDDEVDYSLWDMVPTGSNEYIPYGQVIDNLPLIEATFAKSTNTCINAAESPCISPTTNI